MNITGEELILACSAIGAGLAVMAGIGCCSSRKKPWCKIRYYRNYVTWTSRCGDNWFIWSISCYVTTLCKATCRLIPRDGIKRRYVANGKII